MKVKVFEISEAILLAYVSHQIENSHQAKHLFVGADQF